MENWERILPTMFVDMINADLSQKDPFCPVAADSALRVLFAELVIQKVQGLKGHTILSKMRKAHPDIFRVVTRYLASPRTAEELHALCDPKATLLCSCDKSSILVGKLHPPMSLKIPRFVSPVPNETPMVHFLRSLLWFMCLAWEELVESGHSMSRLFRKAQRSSNGKRWPASQYDLAPFGIEPSIANVCAWADHLPQITVFAVAYRMWSHLAAPSSPKLFVSSVLLDAFLPVAPHLVEKWKKTDRFPSEDIGTLRVLAGVVTSFPFDILLPALHADSERINEFMDAWLQLYLGLDTLMKPAVNARPSSPERDHIEEAQHDFRCCATRLLVAMTMDPASAAVDLKELGGIPRDDFDTLLSFERFLFPKDCTQVCANTSCKMTETRLEKNLSLCSGCTCIYYCSRVCQREAWKHPEAPHRAVCTDLRQIVDAGVFLPNEDNRLTMEERLRAVALEDHQISEIAKHLKAAYSK